jgi:hypothetical protein
MTVSPYLKPRTPSQQELMQLREYIVNHWGMKADAADMRWIEGLIGDAAITVFDNYYQGLTGHPRKLMLVVWHEDPKFHELFIWQDHGRPMRVKASEMAYYHYMKGRLAEPWNVIPADPDEHSECCAKPTRTRWT